ncbi:MAG: FKBP-type peptidyl-prolyl cis-trans isomerase [Clostridia bacterium]|nr:FKBP-type peptidyl-prolyl cis-trans isomerase [Clostridia bacterium]
MKKRIFIVAMLLLCSVLLSACTPKDPAVNQTTASSQGGAQDPIHLQAVLGNWYCEDVLSAIQLKEDYTVDSYSIKAGYYTYSDTASGTFSIAEDGTTLTIQIGESPLELTYDAAKNQLASADGFAFDRIDVLPEKHPVVLFPNYFSLDCASVITLGDYKQITFGETAAQSAAIAIFEEYYEANQDKTKPTVSNRPAAYGDIVVIDYTGYLDGVAFEGGSAKDTTINIVENSGYIPGFAEGIAGHSVGETFDVPVTFPEEYHNKDMAGKSVIFTMTLDAIYDLAIPDADIASYSKDAYQTYNAMLAEYTESKKAEDLWAVLMENTVYTEVPLEFYNYFYQYYVDLYHYYAFSYGMDYATFLAMTGGTEQILKEQTRDVAVPYIIAHVIYDTEKLQWTEDAYQAQLDAFVKDAMEYFKYTEEEATKLVLETELDYIQTLLVYETVTDWFLANQGK